MAPLLIDYAEHVSGRIIEEYPDVVKSLMRGRSGVYALFRGEQLYYVGLASNMMGRINSHLRDRHRRLWDHFSIYLVNDDGHTRELECLLLRIARPRGNRVSGRLRGATDLHKKLHRAMVDWDADRHARLLGGSVARHRRRRKASRKGVRVLGGLVERRISLRAQHRGKQYRATLRRDGTVSYRRKSYEAPSAAATAALGRPANGWTFWRFKQGRKWVALNELRR